VLGCFDQQPAGVRRSGLGDRPLPALWSEVRSEGTIPRNPESMSGAGPRKAAGLGAQPGDGRRFDPEKAPEPRDRWSV
jgi:hypothetical protein